MVDKMSKRCQEVPL